MPTRLMANPARSNQLFNTGSPGARGQTYRYCRAAEFVEKVHKANADNFGPI
jgi:hypothetical protein